MQGIRIAAFMGIPWLFDTFAASILKITIFLGGFLVLAAVELGDRGAEAGHGLAGGRLGGHGRLNDGVDRSIGPGIERGVLRVANQCWCLRSSQFSSQRLLGTGLCATDRTGIWTVGSEGRLVVLGGYRAASL